MLRRDWSLAPLGKALSYRKEFIEIDDMQSYKRCRVQSYGKGVVLRDNVTGMEIKTKRQQVCRAGEFLVAEIDAKVGGFGVVPEELDGAIVSSHYFLYEIDDRELDRAYLGYYVRTPFFQDQVSAQGSTNYAAIRPQHVLEYVIPLPPPDEQHRIVAHIEALAARIDEARGLRAGALEEAKLLLKSSLKSFFGSTVCDDWVQLSRYVAEIENGWSPQALKRPAVDDEWGVLKVGAVSFGVFNPHENKALPPGLSLVGAVALVRETRPYLMLSDKIFRFRLYPDAQISKHYLWYALQSPALRTQIEAGASGTSPTMKNISKDKVRGLFLPRHSPQEQHEIVQQLDLMRRELSKLKYLQAESAAELDTLLPSVLDRAFRGEL